LFFFFPLVHSVVLHTSWYQQKELAITGGGSSSATRFRKKGREKCSAAMAVAYASAYRAAGGKQNRRPAPKRGQVKAAIAASWLHALASVVHGARSVALSRSHSRWSFRSS
jgi:hypothetical protein